MQCKNKINKQSLKAPAICNKKINQRILLGTSRSAKTSEKLFFKVLVTFNFRDTRIPEFHKLQAACIVKKARANK